MDHVSYGMTKYRKGPQRTAKDHKGPTKDRKGALHMTKYRKGPQRTTKDRKGAIHMTTEDEQYRKGPTKDCKGTVRAELQEIGTNWTQWCLSNLAQRVRYAVFSLPCDGVAGTQQSTSTDGNLTVLHRPDAGKKLGSRRRPRADRTTTQTKKQKLWLISNLVTCCLCTVICSAEEWRRRPVLILHELLFVFCIEFFPLYFPIQ